jgi:hypothetical protein
MVLRFAALLVLSTGLLGCLEGAVGQYRVDEVNLLEISCTGIDATRSQTWAAAMRESGVTEMLVGVEEVVGGDTVAQFFREDLSAFTLEIAEADNPDGDDPRFAGNRLDDAISVASAGLGADFSALLEADDIGCEFEYGLTLDLLFRGGEWDEAISTLVIELRQASGSTHACIVENCRAVYEIAARHTSGIDPGLRGIDGD